MTGSLWAAVIIHVLNNTVALLLLRTPLGHILDWPPWLLTAGALMAGSVLAVWCWVEAWTHLRLRHTDSAAGTRPL
ncbi:MAG TPA: hypothetical protein VGF45_01820 [Polyangia bacterium]